MEKHNPGFTIVELATVIVVLSILTAVSLFGYNSWQVRVAQSEVKNALMSAKSSMENARNFDSSSQYPSAINYSPGSKVTLTGGGTNFDYSFCIRGQSVRKATVVYYITNNDNAPTTSACTYP